MCSFLTQKEISRENPQLTPSQQTSFSIMQRRGETSCALESMFESAGFFAYRAEWHFLPGGGIYCMMNLNDARDGTKKHKITS